MTIETYSDDVSQGKHVQVETGQMQINNCGCDLGIELVKI